MVSDAFAVEYLGTFPKPTAADRFAYEAWLEYYDRCEAFDRMACAYQRNGVAMPVSSWERQQTSRHAARLMAEVRRVCAHIDAATMRRAQEAALRDHERGERPATDHLAMALSECVLTVA